MSATLNSKGDHKAVWNIVCLLCQHSYSFHASGSISKREKTAEPPFLTSSSNITNSVIIKKEQLVIDLISSESEDDEEDDEEGDTHRIVESSKNITKRTRTEYVTKDKNPHIRNARVCKEYTSRLNKNTDNLQELHLKWHGKKAYMLTSALSTTNWSINRFPKQWVVENKDKYYLNCVLFLALDGNMMCYMHDWNYTFSKFNFDILQLNDGAGWIAEGILLHTARNEGLRGKICLTFDIYWTIRRPIYPTKDPICDICKEDSSRQELTLNFDYKYCAFCGLGYHSVQCAKNTKHISGQKMTPWFCTEHHKLFQKESKAACKFMSDNDIRLHGMIEYTAEEWTPDYAAEMKSETYHTTHEQLSHRNFPNEFEKIVKKETIAEGGKSKDNVIVTKESIAEEKKKKR